MGDPLPTTTGEEEAVDTSSIRRIARVNVIVYAIAVALSFMFDKSIGSAVAVSGAIAVASFWVSAVSLGPVFRKRRMGFWPGAIYWFKYTFLIASVGVLILVFEMNAIGLVIGFSVILPSIVFEAVRKSSDIREDTPQ